MTRQRSSVAAEPCTPRAPCSPSASTGRTRRRCGTTWAAPCRTLTPRTPTTNHVCALKSFILQMNDLSPAGVIPADVILTEATLPRLLMPTAMGCIGPSTRYPKYAPR